MSEQSSRWSEVGERLEALGLKLKLHFEQSDRRDETAATMEKLRTSVSDAFDAAGNAVKDDAVKADVREAGRLFVDALSATFAKVSEELKERADNLRDKGTPPSTPEPPKPIDPA